MSGSETVFRSTFAVPAMDCPSEENLIRMALQDQPAVQSLSFDLAGRTLVATHRGPADAVVERLLPLGLGARLVGSTPLGGAAAAAPAGAASDAVAEARLLRLVLAINAAMFVLELAVGLWAESAGLLADSLDMLADAAVYGIALAAVGGAAATKARAARFAGSVQVMLALGVLVETGRRFFAGSEPASAPMMAMGLLALAANAACLLLVAQRRHAGAHMKASYIFTSVDVIANAGVIVAGLLVAATGSRHPDLVIGIAIALLVLHGARRILRLR